MYQTYKYLLYQTYSFHNNTSVYRLNVILLLLLKIILIDTLMVIIIVILNVRLYSKRKFLDKCKYALRTSTKHKYKNSLIKWIQFKCYQ